MHRSLKRKTLAGWAWGAVLPSSAESGPRADHGPFPFFPRLETCDLSVMELLRQNSGWVFENPCKEDGTVGTGSISLPAALGPLSSAVSPGPLQAGPVLVGKGWAPS